MVLAPLALAAALVFWSAVLRPASGRYWGSIEAVYEAYRNGVDDETLAGG